MSDNPRKLHSYPKTNPNRFFCYACLRRLPVAWLLDRNPRYEPGCMRRAATYVRLACRQTAHRFPELRVHFVRNDNYVCENLFLVELALMEMQRAERSDLENSRLLNEHCDGVTLRMPHLPVHGSGDRGRPFCTLSIAQTGNHV